MLVLQPANRHIPTKPPAPGFLLLVGTRFRLPVLAALLSCPPAMQAFLDALNRRFPTGSPFRSREWAAVAPAIRQRAFFSATITSARVLTRWRSMLLDYLAGETEEVLTPDGRMEVAYREVGLARFRDRAADMLISEGLATPADFKDARISNPISNARLQLVFNTNIEQAQTFAAWQRRVTDPEYINKFPAARFVRAPGARIKRERHVQAEGEVRRWDDFEFWRFQNAADIGGFGVPWGPFGFNSYMRQEPVRRKEVEKLGLVRPGERVMPPDLTQFGIEPAKQINSGLEAEVDDIPPEIRQKAIRTIQDRLGPQVLTPDGKLTLDAIRRARAL